MTEKDLETLAENLSRTSAEQLRELDDGEILPLPSFNVTSKRRAIWEIMSTLDSIMPTSGRLPYVARLYIWLSVHKVLSTWVLYCVNPFKVPLIYFNVHRRIARMIGGPSHQVLLTPWKSPVARYACLVSPVTDPSTEHTVVCVCVWDGLPYVAIWAVGPITKERLHAMIALALKENSDKQRIGTYPDLASSYVAARTREELRKRLLVDY
ncbi:hypothetical protein MTO96_028293 [Rhipicephalus appendiculatus]